MARVPALPVGAQRHLQLTAPRSRTELGDARTTLSARGPFGASVGTKWTGYCKQSSDQSPARRCDGEDSLC